jgi:hypothetical protein
MREKREIETESMREKERDIQREKRKRDENIKGKDREDR